MKREPRNGASRMRGRIERKHSNPTPDPRAPQTRRNIGGGLDVAAYSALANPDLPDMEQVRCEALRLFHEGRRARDIAEALRLHESLVQDWIAGATT